MPLPRTIPTSLSAPAGSFASATQLRSSLRLKGPCLSSLLRTHTHTATHRRPQQHQPRVLQSTPDASSATCIAPSHFKRLRFLRPLPIMAALSQAQTRAHSHSHAHHHDTSYLTSTDKSDAGVRITRIGLYSNLGMAVAKGVGGYAFNSQAMVADAWHSLTDLASDVLTLATVAWSIKPPTAKFPTGFGKIESLGSLGVSGMLLGGGIFMCLNSVEILYAHFMLDAAAAAEVAAHAHGHSHGHGHGVEGPSLHAAWLALGTVFIKEYLYQATMKVAKERKSSVLASNAVHHRVDSLTGIVTLLAILGANFLHNASWLDPVGGFLISLLVIKAGWGNTTSALYELADAGIDPEVKTNVHEAAEKSFTALSRGAQVEVRDVQGIKSGQNFLVDLEVGVPANWSVAECKEFEEVARAAIAKKVRGVRRLKVRFVAKDSEGTFMDEYIPGDMSAPPEPEHDHEHGNGHVNSHDKKSL